MNTETMQINTMQIDILNIRVSFSNGVNFPTFNLIPWY